MALVQAHCARREGRLKEHGQILLAHGGGGRMSRSLIEAEIAPRFGKGPLKGFPDAASLPDPDGPLVFTTDSFVVQPLEFPGGDIGKLAVHGTVNDICVCGGKPLWLSVGLILEEGLNISLLRRILDSLAAAADECGVTVVTGDTKVVARGQCDGLYINTSGIGRALPGFSLGPEMIRPGDAVLASGPLGDHGMAVLCAREAVLSGTGPMSDTGPVHRLVAAAADMAGAVRFMRDPTRGGVAAVVNEAVHGTPCGVALDEQNIPVSPATRSAAELLGLDILHVASEGRILLFCAPEACDPILTAWKAIPEGRNACRMGTVTADAGSVLLNTLAGGRRLVDMPQGELLPRIC
ncbi:MAG: hydrogenase expression/formation protein HypE [Lentisphaerae bacterium]|nr:hydrogenase expression/formation protein HypE [Lentisphaerota bacterium]